MANREIDEYLDSIVKKTNDYFQEEVFPRFKEIDLRLKNFEKSAKAVAKAKKTGDLKSLDKYNFKGQTGRDSLKENSCPNNKENNQNKNILSIKQERVSTISDITEKDNHANEMPAPTMIPPKKKRVKKEKLSTVKVKKEVINDMPTPSTRSTRSKASSADRSSDIVLVQNPNVSLIEITDSDEEITKQTNKKPVRSTRTRTRTKETSESDESSVSLSATRCTRSRQKTVKKAEEEEAVVRSTKPRTKVKQKRDRSQSGDSKTSNHKRSKSDPSKEEERDKNDTVATEYEDALSTLENRPENSTFIVPKKLNNGAAEANKMIMMDKTMVVLRKSSEEEKKKRKDEDDEETTTTTTKKNIVSQENNNLDEDLLTDDESGQEEEICVSPQKAKINNKKKEVFSPYDRSPVKKKVEAFEKLKKNELHSNSKANTSRVLREIQEEKKGNVKEKAKGFTPVSVKTLFKPSSATKIGKYVGYSSSTSSSTSASNTSMKCGTPVRPPLHQSRSEFRERELKRQEQRNKEMKKQELAKRAVSIERKKKYEEIRVHQQHKEAMEMEKKKKALEAQKLKEERHKMVLKEKEEKQRLLKEEHDRKRLLAKMRAEEKRKEEEKLAAELAQEKEKRQREQKQQQQQQQIEATTPSAKKATATSQHVKNHQRQVGDLPIYLREPTPRLPTKDCYDSDEEEREYERRVPGWCGSIALSQAARAQHATGHRLKNTMFCCANQYVDLQEIFQRIDPRKLKRTSSACWTKPPRYTMLPGYDED